MSQTQMLSKMPGVQVCASSPHCRGTDPKALMSRNFVRTSFAGPRIADGTRTTWWMVDLGPGHGLMCNFYTLRQDGSRNFLRSWVLQVGNLVQKHSLQYGHCKKNDNHLPFLVSCAEHKVREYLQPTKHSSLLYVEIYKMCCH